MEERDEQHRKHDAETAGSIFSSELDLSEQLFGRYAKSAAPQHQHLCATAAAMRSILLSESLPLTPPAYFAATISSVSEITEDSDSAAALLSFLSLTLPLVPSGSVSPDKAADAVSCLINILRTNECGVVVPASTARAAVKCLGFLLGFCDLEDWGSVKPGFSTLVLYSIDKRPKVRKCAQFFVEKVFRSFQCSRVVKKASKVVASLMKHYMRLAVKINAPSTVDGSKPEHLGVIHMLIVLKLTVPYLSAKVCSKALSQLSSLLGYQFSPLTRHVFNVLDALFGTSEVEIITEEAESIIVSLAAYLSSKENSKDIVMAASALLKCAFNKLLIEELNIWCRHLPLVYGSIAGLLTSDPTVALQASSLLKELINDHVDEKSLLRNKKCLSEEADGCLELSAIKSICGVFENVLNSCGRSVNEHALAAISTLFIRLGETSSFFMKSILLKLADLMVLSSGNLQLHECLGSAVVAMGPERILTILPISLNVKDCTCSNIWLVPVLIRSVDGASLGYFLEHIMPLAESFKQASCKVKKSVIREDLLVHAKDLLGLLPAFCRHPTDLHQNIAPLVEFFIGSLRDPNMIEAVAVSLQELIRENRGILKRNPGDSDSKIHAGQDSTAEFKKISSYSKKTAARNINALSSFSMQLLQCLTDVLHASHPEKYSYLMDSIGCMASIADPSATKKILMSSLEKFELMHVVDNLHNLESCRFTTDEENNLCPKKAKQWCLALLLASCLVHGADENLLGLIYKFVRHTLQAANGAGQLEAYFTLNRILEEHPWFCSSQYSDLLDFLLGIKPPVEAAVMKSRFSSLRLLFVHVLEKSEDEDTRIFLILNEIILLMKSKDEIRKVAYDTLLAISSTLRGSSTVDSDAPRNKLIAMIMGYVSGPSPQIKSAAVSALSLLIYKNTDMCVSMPDIIPFILTLLQSKAVEVVKAALGFVKVVVSCLQAEALQGFLSDIVNAVLPWSSVSRNHFRSKVIVILEMIIRKFGSAAVELLAPEEYKKFIRTVKEQKQHHGKSGSKESSPPDRENSSFRRPKRGRVSQGDSGCLVKKRKVGAGNGIGGRTNERRMRPGSDRLEKQRGYYNKGMAKKGPGPVPKKSRKAFPQRVRRVDSMNELSNLSYDSNLDYKKSTIKDLEKKINEL